MQAGILQYVNEKNLSNKKEINKSAGQGQRIIKSKMERKDKNKNKGLSF